MVLALLSIYHSLEECKAEVLLIGKMTLEALPTPRGSVVIEH